jgi:HTH-type transcriptional regulator/antitoxin HigA
MAAKTRGKAPGDYFALVRELPLTHIRDDAHLAEAHKMIDRLLQRDLSDGQQQYLDVLTDLVEAYEDEHHPIPGASEADVLRELMRSNDLSQPKLAKMAGIAQSTISAVLNGGRSLTRKQVVKLARCFNVSAAVFLPA